MILSKKNFSLFIKNNDRIQIKNISKANYKTFEKEKIMKT